MSRQTLLLVEKCSHAFSFYDIATGTRESSVALPDFPHEFVVDPERRFAYVGHYGVETSGHRGDGGHAILVIDLHHRRLARTIDISPFNRPHGMRMDRAGRLYVLAEDRAVLLGFDDPARAEAPDWAVPVGGIKSHLFVVADDGSAAYCMNLLSHTVTRVTPRDATQPPLAVSPGQKPEGCWLSEDGRTLTVTCRISGTLAAIDTQTMRVVRSRPICTDPTRIYGGPDDSLLVTGYGAGKLVKVDPATLEPLAALDLPARPIALSLHPDGATAFVSLDNGTLVYVDPRAMAVRRTIPTQLEPDVSLALIDLPRLDQA